MVVPAFSMNVVGRLRRSSSSFEAIQRYRGASRSVVASLPALTKCHRSTPSATAQPTHEPVAPCSPTFHHGSRKSLAAGGGAARSTPARRAWSTCQSSWRSDDGSQLRMRATGFRLRATPHGLALHGRRGKVGCGTRRRAPCYSQPMGNLGAWEIALIVRAILLVFGPKKLPGMGRSLGRGMREFKDSVGETAKELKDATADTPAALRDGFNPKQQFKDAMNPFAEEKQDEEVLDGEIVAPTAAAPAPEGSTEPEPAADETPTAASSERA